MSHTLTEDAEGGHDARDRLLHILIRDRLREERVHQPLRASRQSECKHVCVLAGRQGKLSTGCVMQQEWPGGL